MMLLDRSNFRLRAPLGRTLAALSILSAGAAEAQTAGAALPADGASVVQVMHDRYAGKWYKTLTFVQNTVRYDQQGTPHKSVWYESSAQPSLLRIDMGDPANGNGELSTADSTYSFRGGKLVRTRAEGNPLTTLLFDVYLDPPARTLERLKAQKIDLSKVHVDTWNGQPVWVVGAAAGDSASAQFWVDPVRLQVVRQIESMAMGSETHRLDARISDFRPAGGGWVGAHFEFHMDGKLVQTEDYTEIKPDVPLDRRLFDITQWTTAPHWARPAAKP